MARAFQGLIFPKKRFVDVREKQDTLGWIGCKIG
jgi:hypothetical protein